MRGNTVFSRTTPIGNNLTTNDNMAYASRPNTDFMTYKILLRLSDLPCFNNG